MKKLSRHQRKQLSDGFIELANLSAAGLIFGQLIAKTVIWWLLLVGFIITAFLYIYATKLIKDYF